MTQIVNNDKLTFLITTYGLNRITEALGDSSVNITLTKIKIGDAFGEYYEPVETATDLVHEIPDGEFPIAEKELLEDNITVSLLAVIPETSSGYDIREVGLYETVNGQDFLFAIGTQQPLVKPSIDDNYVMSVDYYLFLRAQNLAEVYDQIVLDPDTQLVTDKDLSDLMSTVLFSQTNLMDQIGHNSFSIGLNRAAQLQERIVADELYASHFASYSNYTSLLETVRDNIFGYWVFDYARRSVTNDAIVDYSNNGNNLDLSQAVNLFEKKLVGLSSTLMFDAPKYFTLSADAPLSFLNEENTADVDFHMFFCLKPLGTGDRTLLARSSYATGVHSFEIKELSNRSLFMRIFTDSSNYITFTSSGGSIPDGFHVISIAYESATQTVEVIVNGLLVSVTKTITGTYTHMSSTTSINGVTATSYIISAENERVDNIDSQIAMIAVIKRALTTKEAKNFTLLLSSAVGENPCILIS